MCFITIISVVIIYYTKKSPNQTKSTKSSVNPCIHSSRNPIILCGSIVDPPKDLNIDVIVNPANESMKNGGGVEGAIIKSVGGEQVWENLLNQSILPPSNTLNICGDVVVVDISSVSSPISKYIFNVRGPDCSKNEDKKILPMCYKNVLQKAKEMKLKTVMFPLISQGIFNCYNDTDTQYAIQYIKDANVPEIQSYIMVYK